LKSKYLILFALLLTGRAWATNTPFPIAIGQDFTCALDVEGATCWSIYEEFRRDKYPYEYLPNLKNPLQIAANVSYTCVMNANEVKCSGDYDIEHSVPVLKSPRQMVGGNVNACALDAEGVKCWGRKDTDISNIPPMNSPTQIVAGWFHMCAIDADGVKCWGDNKYGQTNVPKLNSPIQVSAGMEHTCALDADGVKCWGHNSDGQLNVPALKSPTQITSGANHNCVLDAEGLKCWGSNMSWQLDVPSDLKSPIQVTAGFYRTCALNMEGMRCWGGSAAGIVYPFLKFEILKPAVGYLPSARADYIRAVIGNKNSLEKEVSTYYLECLLSASAILSTDSSYFSNEYVPKFNGFKERLQYSLSYVTSDISEVPDSETHRKIAIQAIQSSLSIGAQFLSVPTAFENSLRVAGAAFAEPINNQKIKDLVLQIDALVAEKQKLRSSTKSAFLVDTLELAANWLREKVK